MSTYTMSAPLPALFIGHGTPMNALEHNRYTAAWSTLAKTLPRPKAILVISAHWYTEGTAVTAMKQPTTIHDFAGFPESLFAVQYPAPGSPELAARIGELLAPIEVYQESEQWGLDHGSWEILVQMYPDADIPVVQLSIDAAKPAQWHYSVGQKLAALRKEGVLILGSGNVVHNLSAIRWQAEGSDPYPWAVSFEQYVAENIASRQQPHPLTQALERQEGKLSNPSAEHFLPLLYILGTWDQSENISIPIQGIELASLSMMSVLIGG